MRRMRWRVPGRASRAAVTWVLGPLAGVAGAVVVGAELSGVGFSYLLGAGLAPAVTLLYLKARGAPRAWASAAISLILALALIAVAVAVLVTFFLDFSHVD